MALSLYLDASVLVSLFSDDAKSSRAKSFFRSDLPALIVSDFAAAEFASAVARQVRMERMTPSTARSIFSNFDTWSMRATQRVATTGADVDLAAAYIRRLDLGLRAPDAINIAIAQRLGARLATFDMKMAAGATAVMMPVENL